MASFLPRLRIIGPYRRQETFLLPSAQSYGGGDSSFRNPDQRATSFYRRWENLQRMGGRIDLRDLGRGGGTSGGTAEGGPSGSMGDGRLGGRLFVSKADLAEEQAWLAENAEEDRLAAEAAAAAAKPPRTFLTQQEIELRAARQRGRF